LEIIVQINFMIEIDFFMEKVHESIRDVSRIIVYHGLRTMEQHQVLIRVVAPPISAAVER
jgi:hypothetical protein